MQSSCLGGLFTANRNIRRLVGRDWELNSFNSHVTSSQVFMNPFLTSLEAIAYAIDVP